MGTLTGPSLVAFFVCLAGRTSGAGPELTNSQRDERLEALAKRVTNVEALIGPEEKATPGKPTLTTRVERLEARPAAPGPEAGLQQKAATEDVARLQQQVGELTVDLRDLAKRVEALARPAGAERTDDALREVRRDLERLRKDLDAVQAKVR